MCYLMIPHADSPPEILHKLRSLPILFAACRVGRMGAAAPPCARCLNACVVERDTRSNICCRRSNKITEKQIGGFPLFYLPRDAPARSVSSVGGVDLQACTGTHQIGTFVSFQNTALNSRESQPNHRPFAKTGPLEPVSYTHLTLPTKA